MPPPPPLFAATCSTTRAPLLPLLRTIAFAKSARVHLTPTGLRFTTASTSVLEAFVHLPCHLFTTYNYHPTPPPSSQDDPPDSPVFEINLASLLETLNIFSLSDPIASRKPAGGGQGDRDAFAAHRLRRHAGFTALSNHTFGVDGVCTFTYDGPGQPLRLHTSESGVTTTADLTTYEAETTEEIPFHRENVAVKTIMPSSALLDAVTELAHVSPETVTITATPSSRPGAHLALKASGALGDARVEWRAGDGAAARGGGDGAGILETHQCGEKISARFRFGLLKAARSAMGVATKVSLRLDGDGVLSAQFLVEVEGAGEDGVVFVDFRVVPLVDDEEEEEDEEGEDGGRSGEEE